MTFETIFGQHCLCVQYGQKKIFRIMGLLMTFDFSICKEIICVKEVRSG